MVSGCLWQVSLTGVGLLLNLASAAEPVDYVSEAVTAIQALNQAWYDTNTGLWNNAWWNSGNALTTLADFTSLRLTEANRLNLGAVIRNTYNRAQMTTVQTTKTRGPTGLMTTQDCLNCDPASGQDRSRSRRGSRGSLGTQGFSHFLNDYYDDEGWWALGLIHSFDATGDGDYLQSAVEIFADMQTGQGTPCAGGIYWDKSHSYVNAIANELYLAVAAALANRVSAGTYLPIAQHQWEWFQGSGMINAQGLVNDGLDSNCRNNGLTTWSYNQGVILGALVELAYATKDRAHIDTATAIANAAIDRLSNADGILVEADRCELRSGHCGMDGQQFKGVFVRNLRYLHAVAPSDKFADFITRNAISIWANDQSQDGRLGVAWTGPYVNATGPSHSSALDCLVAAIAVS
ncbi:putative mannan endo-1 [Escovopsis weberi]|uniref:Putative mannan endo-1 n=1 Tax=Escovopsis weberi TaxID=150374 RepID=A0A0M8MSB9_ESCWE|nr:putative mannan endo-1 [Escovopsis weberi]